MVSRQLPGSCNKLNPQNDSASDCQLLQKGLKCFSYVLRIHVRFDETSVEKTGLLEKWLATLANAGFKVGTEEDCSVELKKSLKQTLLEVSAIH